MATSSYPAVGQQGFTEDQWATMYGGRDGIVEDYTGTAFAHSLIDQGDICRVFAGKASINGYILSNDTATDLVIPAVASGAQPVTYYVAAKYDPALNVAQGPTDPNPGQRSVLGPCRLVVTTNLSTAGGVAYAVLWKFVRSASQVLSAVQRFDQRRWIGPIYEMREWNDKAAFGPVPRGSILIQTDDSDHPGTLNYSVMTLVDNQLDWVSDTNTAEIDFPAPSSLVAYDAPAKMSRLHGWNVALTGTLERSNGAKINNGSPVSLGTLPVGWRPTYTRRFVVFADDGPVRIKIDTSGAVTMYDPGTGRTVLIIALDGIIFRGVN